MAFYPKRKESSFTPAPEGLHRCVCVDVVDLGIIKTNYMGNEFLKDMLRIVWQTEDKMPSGKPYIITRRYTNSTHKKAALRQHCETWRGKAFTDEEFAAFDLDQLLGKNCQIQIAHNVSNGETYANVMAIVPPVKGLPNLTGQDYKRVKDRPGYVPPVKSQPDPGTDDGWGESTATEEPAAGSDDDIPF